MILRARFVGFWILILLLFFPSPSIQAADTFIPPPRRIDDVLEALRASQVSDPEQVAKWRKQLEGQPPAGLFGTDLAGFYHDRGEAANNLGDAEARLENLRKSAEVVEGGEVQSKEFMGSVYRKLAWAELVSGNPLSAIAAAEKSQSIVDYNWGAMSQLVQFNAWIGNIGEAERWLDRLEDTRPSRGSWRRWYRVQVARAHAALAEGEGRWPEYEVSLLESIERLEDTGEEHKYPGFMPFLIADLADPLIPQGRAVEAEVRVREGLALALERQGRLSYTTANILRKLARTLVAQGRFDEAQLIVDEALGVMDELGLDQDGLFPATTRFIQIQIASAQDDWETVLAATDLLDRTLQENRIWYDRYMYGNAASMIALVKTGRPADAVEPAKARFEKHQDLLGEKHYDTAEAGVVYAMVLAAMGGRQEAFDLFRTNVPYLLSRSRQSDGANRSRAVKERHLKILLESYIGMLHDMAAAGGAPDGFDAAGEALIVADLIRAQSVQRALAANAARGAAKDPALAELVRKEQDARRRISALYGRIAELKNAPPEEQDPGAIEQLAALIDSLRDERARMMGVIERDFPDYADLINPKPPAVANIQAMLRPGEAMISFYLTGERSYVWAIPKSGPVRFAAADLSWRDAAGAVHRLRRALDPRARTLGEIPAYDLDLAHDLYNTLLAPVAEGWKQAGSLLIVADGALGYLPFGVLVTAPAKLRTDEAVLFASYRDVPWLARDHAISVLPSTTALNTLRRGERSVASQSFVGFGDPIFNLASAEQPLVSGDIETRGILDLRGLPIHLRSVPDTGDYVDADLSVLPRLPDTGEELRQIALALSADPTTQLFLGAEASEKRVRSMELSGYKILAFATHGLVPGDLNGLVEPALALSAPKEAGPEDDGLLTMSEILGLRLDADWVVLSACNTGAGDGAGAEAVSGLGRAFFYAGSRALLVTNWPVETTSARRLTSDIFARQAADGTLSRAGALQGAMLALMDSPGYRDGAGKTLFSYAHPIFWAPFSLIGDGG